MSMLISAWYRRGGVALTFALMLPLASGGCGGAPPTPEARPVLVESEDVGEADVACTIVRRFEVRGAIAVAEPALARGPRGTAVTWVDREAGHRHLRLLELSPQLAPLGDALSIDPGGEMPLNTRLSSCGQRLTAVWQLEEAAEHSIRVASVSLGDDGPTENGQVVVTTRGVQPAVGCDGSTAAVAWSVREDGVQDILLRWLGHDGSLSPEVRVSGETDSASDPALACDAGRCAVVWSDRRAVYAEIYATILEAGSDEPLEPVRVSRHDQTLSGAGGAYVPDVSSLGNGRFIVAWHDNRSRDESEVYTATLTDRGNAGGDHRISRSPAPSTMASTASCADDRGLVAWRDRRDGPPSVMVAAVDARGRRRSAATKLSGSVDEASAPASVCVGRDHVVAWTEADTEGSGGALMLVQLRCQ